MCVCVRGAAPYLCYAAFRSAVQDDIGDGSVFAFYKLSPEEQEAKIAELQSSAAE